MSRLFRKNKYLVFYTLVLFVGVFLLSGGRLFAMAAPAGDQIVQGASNDFYADATRGLQTLSESSSSRIVSRAINGAEYKSAWDQFGMSVLIQGTASPAEILKNIAQDILSSVQTEHAYDTAEAQYLSISGVAPEEVLSAEGEGNSDIPPGMVVNPNPSSGENPDTSWASSEDPATIGDTTPTETAPTESTSTEVSPDTGTTTDSGNHTSSTEAISASDATFSNDGENASSSDMSTSSDEAIFNAILSSELSNSSQLESALPQPIPQPDASAINIPAP